MIQTAPVELVPDSNRVPTPQERHYLISAYPPLDFRMNSPFWFLSTVSKQFEINAAHWLPLHNGKCKFVHGHNYTFDVKVTGWYNSRGQSNREFFVVEFGILNDIIKDTIGQWDHKFLVHYTAEELEKLLPTQSEQDLRGDSESSGMGFDGAIPEFGITRDKMVPLGGWSTAENLARVAADIVATRLDAIYPEKNLEVEVTCWETPRTSATARAKPRN